jgi:hypothetical protein
VVQVRADPRREILDVESVAGHLLPAGGVFACLAAHRRELFPDELFCDLFSSGRGRPSIPANVVASVIVLQTCTGSRTPRRSRRSRSIEAAGTVTCPNGLTARITRTRKAVFGARCRDCPLRARCTSSARGRKLTLHPHDAL